MTFVGEEKAGAASKEGLGGSDNEKMIVGNESREEVTQPASILINGPRPFA